MWLFFFSFFFFTCTATTEIYTLSLHDALPICGGFIFPTASKGTFAVGGGCRHGSGIAGVPYWGHLEYHDHGLDLNVHWNDITAYFPEGTTGTDPQTGQPTGTRWVCGKARNDMFEIGRATCRECV